MVIKQLAFLFAVIVVVTGHTYHVGKCPVIEPVKEFNMDKFLGKWYVIERTSTKSKDFYLTYSKSPGHNEYTVSQWSTRSGIIGSIVGSIVGRNKTEAGKLTLGREYAAQMTVKFPLNPASYNYTVFMTDYETYAGIFSCQEVLGTNRRMANILSRTPTLDQQYLNKIRSHLSLSGVNPFDLRTIQHTEPDYVNTTEPLPTYDMDVRLGEIETANLNYTFF